MSTVVVFVVGLTIGICSIEHFEALVTIGYKYSLQVVYSFSVLFFSECCFRVRLQNAFLSLSLSLSLTKNADGEKKGSFVLLTARPSIFSLTRLIERGAS